MTHSFHDIFAMSSLIPRTSLPLTVDAQSEGHGSFDRRRPGERQDRAQSLRARLDRLQEEYRGCCERTNAVLQSIQEVLLELDSLGDFSEGPAKQPASLTSKPERAPFEMQRNLDAPSILNSTPTPSVCVSLSAKSKCNANARAIAAAATKPESNAAIKCSSDIPLIAVTGSLTVSRAFSRKPRAVLFNPSERDSLYTCAIDGTMQRWSMQTRTCTWTALLIPEGLPDQFVDDLCWDSTGRSLLVGCATTSASAGNSHAPQVFQVFPSPDHLPLVRPRHECPHERGISAIAALKASRFVTGGYDKAVRLWTDRTVDVLHTRHTSFPASIVHAPPEEILWSGGADCRIIGYSLKSGRVALEARWDVRIAHTMHNANLPNNILCTVASRDGQFRLLDPRMPLSRFTSFGWPEELNTSRYLRPSWHAAGNLIACGTLKPLPPGSSGVHVWDVRNLSARQLIPCSDQRLVCTQFHPTDGVIVAASTENSSATFIYYST